MMNFLAADCNNPDLLTIIKVIQSAYTLLQIGVPIILLVIGTVDLGKAVMAGDEKEIKAATGMLMKRAGAAVGVFILFYVVSFITGLLPVQSDWKTCWNSNGTTQNKTDDGKSGSDDSDKQNLSSYLYY